MSKQYEIAKKLERWPVEKLVPYEYNARTHDADQVESLAASIKEFGFTAPILVDGSAGIVAGHGRLLAAKLLGMAEVPVIVLDHLTDEQRRAYIIADNALADQAGWDRDTLGRELAALEMDGYDLAGLGLDPGEVDALLENVANLAGLEEPGEPEDMDNLGGGEGDAGSSGTGAAEGEPPAPEVEPTTQTGDIWILGKHRIRCGDCRDVEGTNALFAGDRPPLLLSDPPYCSGGFQESQKKAGTWGKIAADNLSARGYQALMSGMMMAARPQASYLFTDWRMWLHLFDTVEASSLAVRAMIVWDKGWPSLGHLWRAQHELIMYAARDGLKRQPGQAGSGNVLTAKRTGNHHHYTEKPVDLLSQILEIDGRSYRGPCPVYDAFLGSGSTLLAADSLDRVCYAHEVEPRFVDVAVLRWQETTGGEAIHEQTGKTWRQISDDRLGAEL